MSFQLAGSAGRFEEVAGVEGGGFGVGVLFGAALADEDAGEERAGGVGFAVPVAEFHVDEEGGDGLVGGGGQAGGLFEGGDEGVDVRVDDAL